MARIWHRKRMKIVLLLFSSILFALNVEACPFCNRETREAIINSRLYPNLLVMLSAFFVIALIVLTLSVLTRIRYRANVSKYPTRQILNPVPLFTTAAILGIGIGGFIDGIVFHQILQWHEMLSNKLPPDSLINKTVNMFWDGIFHLFTLIITFIGILILWKLSSRRDIDHSGRLVAGGMLTGWGIFNIVEGFINHHWLMLHNVREISTNKEAWNYGFIGISLLLVLIGLYISKARHDAYRRPG